MLELIAEAYTSRQIADALFISIKTVERHPQNILDKLGMRDRVELTLRDPTRPDPGVTRTELG